MKFFSLSIPSRIGNVLGDIAATLLARTWVYVAQLDSCQETFEICGRLVPVGHQGSLRRIGQHCALPLSVLDDEDVRNALFVGFDEVYFSLEEFRNPQPAPLLLSCRTIEQIVLDEDSVRWLEQNECLLGLGDGFVLNILVGYRTTSRAHPAVHLPVFGTFVSLA
jgi:hypothetical protein